MAFLTLIIGNKNYSSWSLRPWLALKQFGFSFDEVRIPLYTPEASEQIRQYCPNGNGKVPILIHESRTVWDSMAIFEYLSEMFPERSWWAGDRSARAMARSICAEMHSGFLPLRTQMSMNCREHFPNYEIQAEVQKDIDRITTIWQYCRETYGAGGAFLFGRFTIADAVYAPVVLRFRTYDVKLDAVCQAYADAILALPAMQEWLEAANAETETIQF
ncbi:glutathione S-transferase family protein [Leptolyngbya boryana CZ1]|uniref:Glutathione S-transferase family protein n=1 Tax=Leptolyngbya boryana CZ1 TaxID=3060204 RepID=A0AA96X0K4_LEPBY|nr:glutathione S-transferase family protein [Leptolyngbya boryana]WNZ48123.1 glutathione S-transferase family protein [Leptolyngbya boryana CZ1]